MIYIYIYYFPRVKFMSCDKASVAYKSVDITKMTRNQEADVKYLNMYLVKLLKQIMMLHY